MSEDAVRYKDIQRIENASADHEKQIRSQSEALTALQSNWAVTKTLAGIFGLTGVAILGFLFYVNSKASSASTQVSNEVSNAKSAISQFVDEKKIDLLPIGTIVPFGGPFMTDSATDNYPVGWLPCDGRAVSSSEGNRRYSRLHKTIGTLWGNGTIGKNADPPKTNFNVPDLRGVFLRGVDGGSRRDPDAANRLASNSGSGEADSVGSLQPHATARPTKPFSIPKSNLTAPYKEPYVVHEYVFSTGDGESGSLTRVRDGNSPLPEFTVTDGGDSESRPINVSVNYIIKY